MAYNEKLAERIRQAFKDVPTVKEKKMFGGLAFMVNNKLCVTVGADRIMCRINPELQEKALERKGCHTVIMRGREYKGFVHVEADSLKNKRDLSYWLELALSFNKIAKASKRRKT